MTSPPTRYVKEPDGIKHLLDKQVLINAHLFGHNVQYAGKLVQIRLGDRQGKGAGVVLDRAWCKESGKKQRFCKTAVIPWSHVYNATALTNDEK